MNVCVTINNYHCLPWLFLRVCALVSSVPSLFDSDCTRDLPAAHVEEWPAGAWSHGKGENWAWGRNGTTNKKLPSMPTSSPLIPWNQTQQHSHTGRQALGKNLVYFMPSSVADKSEGLSFRPVSPIQGKWGGGGAGRQRGGDPPSSNHSVPGPSSKFEGSPTWVRRKLRLVSEVLQKSKMRKGSSWLGILTLKPADQQGSSSNVLPSREQASVYRLIF